MVYKFKVRQPSAQRAIKLAIQRINEKPLISVEEKHKLALKSIFIEENGEKISTNVGSILSKLMPFFPLRIAKLLGPNRPGKLRELKETEAGFQTKFGARRATARNLIKASNETPLNPTNSVKLYIPFRDVKSFFTKETVQKLHRRGISKETLITWSKSPKWIEECLQKGVK